MRRLLLLLTLGWMLVAARASATAYTVKAGGGGSFTTIQACATAAVAGDSCTVFAGTYAENPLPAASGSAGNPITFKVNPGDCVSVHGFRLASLSYIVIGTPEASHCTNGSFTYTGFEINTTTISFASATHITIQNNYIHDVSDICLHGPSTIGAGTATYFQVLNNTLTTCGGGGGVQGGIGMEGDHWLVDSNTFAHVADGVYLYGSFNVIRGNHFGPITAAEQGSNHPDGIESTCAGVGTDYPLVHMLYERNVTLSWRDSDGHGLLLRDINACGQTENILRFNQMMVIGSNFISNDGSGTTAGTKTYIYNNSISNMQRDVTGNFSDLTFTQGGTGAVVINNIFQDDWNSTPPYCIYVDATSTSGFVENHNLCFMTGFLSTWQTGSQGPYSVTDIFNQDPKFVSPTSDLHLQGTSPAYGTGGPLTTAVGSGTSSTALTVANAALFSDGYGIAGVQADWIRIGASTTVQIASINYSTNVITLATAVSWANGASIYLYKDSSGNVVLNGTNPNIGFDQGTGASPFPVLPTLPQATVNTTLPTQTGTVRTVTAGSASDLQAKINASTCGDTIIVPANNTYTGNFTIPNEGACVGWILIESSAIGSLPAGTRVSGSCTPATFPASTCPVPATTNMATLVSSVADTPTITFSNSAHNWRLMGLEVTQSGAQHDYSLIETDHGQVNTTLLPSYIIVDRCYVHGTVGGAVRRGISLQAMFGAVIDSDVREIHDQTAPPGMGADAQAVWAFNTPGPLLLRNNFLSAAGENVLFGGTDPHITNLVPSDITIIGNHYWKDWTAWHGNGYDVKNIQEFKNAQRVLLDGNAIELNWLDGQVGFAVLLTPRNQSGGCNWCVVQDVTITHNLIKNASSGIETTGSDDAQISLPVNRVLMQNNLLTALDDATFGGEGRGILTVTNGGVAGLRSDNITLDHNTIFGSTAFMFLGDVNQVGHYQLTNDLGGYGLYGIIGNGVGVGSAAINTFIATPIYNDIVLANTNPGGYPAGTFWSGTYAGMGFTSVTGTSPNLSGNFQLTGASAYHNAGTDGKDIGVYDWTCFNAETNAALAGTFTATTFCGSQIVSTGTTLGSGTVLGGGTVIQ
jgi:hypothetical protein